MSFLSGTPMRRGKKKTAASPQSRPAVYRKPKAQTLDARRRFQMERQESEMRTKPQVRKATKIELGTVPTNIPKKENPRAKTKVQREPTVTMSPQLYQKLGDYIFRGDMSTTITELKTDVAPPPPIRMSYSLHQSGSSARLKTWKKQYPSTSYDIPKLTSYIHPAGVAEQETRQIQETTTAGFGRANVHTPWSWHDHSNYVSAATKGGGDLLTCQQSCFNRCQIEQTMHRMYTDAYGSSTPVVTWDDFLDSLEDLRGGDQSYGFPLNSIESLFTYTNRNVMTPMNMSVYLCTPKKDLPGQNSPQRDWFNPWADSKPSEGQRRDLALLMDSDYRYDPQVTSQENVIVSGNDPTSDSVTMVTNDTNILTTATEVVKDASPNGFSAQFRENWEILTVKSVRLQPGQSLELELSVHPSKLLDLDRFLGFATETGESKYYPRMLFEGLTLFPMIKFWGDPVDGASQGLSMSVDPEDPRPVMNNRVFQSTEPDSAPCMMTANQKNKVRLNVPAAPLRGNSSTVDQWSLESILINLTTRARNLFKYNSPERGQQTEYYKTNDFVDYFVGQAPLEDGTLYTQIATVHTREGQSVTPGQNPSFSNISLANPKLDREYLQISVASTRAQKNVKASVGEKNN